MENWNGIALMTRIMHLALTICLMAAGLAWIQGLKKDSLVGLFSGTSLIPADVGGAGNIDADPQSQLLKAIRPCARSNQPWNEEPLPHPNDRPSLTIMARRSDCSGSECECLVRFGDGAEAVRRWLPLNCPGGTLLNAYWYPAAKGRGQCIRLESPLGEYLIDFDRQKTHLLLRCAGRVFAGEITERSPGHLTASSVAPSDEAETAVYVGGNRAEDISGTPPAAAPGKFFGTLVFTSSGEVRFLPVD